MDDVMKPRGGCPCQLDISEVECMYCSRSILRGVAHRTCPVCAAEWQAAFGELWFEETWHTDLVAAHRRVFGSKNAAVVSLIEDAPLTEDNKLVPVTVRTRQLSAHPCAYDAVKDILIVASAVRNSSILASAGVAQNDARLHSLQEWGTAIGATKMCALLIARGFKNDNGKGPLSIPSKGTLARYVAEARKEVAAYVPEGQVIMLPVMRKRRAAVAA